MNEPQKRILANFLFAFFSALAATNIAGLSSMQQIAVALSNAVIVGGLAAAKELRDECSPGSSPSKLSMLLIV